jgi:hypothetical protein
MKDFIYIAGPKSAPPPNTKQNIILELRSLCDGLYNNRFSKPDIYEMPNGVILKDNDSFVEVTFLKNSQYKDQYGCLIELRVEGAHWQFDKISLYDYKLAGEFTGYQVACQEAFSLFMHQKVTNLWLEQF